jgi:hypothetical protein
MKTAVSSCAEGFHSLANEKLESKDPYILSLSRPS